MAPKKTHKINHTSDSKKTGKKRGPRGLWGVLKGKIQYKDDSIFNLG